MATHGSRAQQAATRFTDELKAMFAAVSNIVFLVAVVALWLMEKPVFGHRQLHSSSLLTYIIGTLLLIPYYLFLSNNGLRSLGELLVSTAREGVPDAQDNLIIAPVNTSRLGRVTKNLWTPVTFNFLLVGWLIYASGGISNSPYSQVPLAMILIGQSTYDVPDIRFPAHIKAMPVIYFARRIAQLYWSSLLVVGSLLTGLLLIQKYHPLVTRQASTTEFFIIMLISLFASMCITFLTRRADRAAPRHTG